MKQKPQNFLKGESPILRKKRKVILHKEMKVKSIK